MKEFIIESLLDTDFYKFTMGQLVFHRYKDVPVKYAFKNRTREIQLANCVNEKDLRKELDHVRDLRFTNSDLHYLRGTNEYSERMFKEDYLEFLRNLRLPPYFLKREKDSYCIEINGSWAETIYWETFILSIVNELFYCSVLAKLSRFKQDIVKAVGKMRLNIKIELLKKNPQIIFTDFGTRRRFSRKWQDYVIGVLTEELPSEQFRGSSNVYLAMKYGLVPMGTSAHEMYMVMAGIMNENAEQIRCSHNRVLCDWWDEYGWGLSIALADNYGSDFFFRDMTKEQAEKWKGLRQDSGDPILFGEKAIKFYEQYSINQKEKIIVFSDGLDIEKMIEIINHFAGRIKITFGWGTNLTNDLGLKPLSLVVKIAESCGHGAVKLSDNIEKAIGKPKDIERFKKIFGYTNDFAQKCRY